MAFGRPSPFLELSVKNSSSIPSLDSKIVDVQFPSFDSTEKQVVKWGKICFPYSQRPLLAESGPSSLAAIGQKQPLGHAKGCAPVYRKPEAQLCSGDWPTERLGPRAGSSACAE